MRLFKIFAFMLSAAVFIACSDDNKLSYNTTTDAVVSMDKSEFVTKENRNIVKVPIKVTGERNGIVTAVVAVQEITGSAMEDVHYLITSKSINIAEDSDMGYVEIKIVDDPVENDDRAFIINLVNVEGAKMGDLTQTIVTIKDNDSDPYDKLCGTWKMECIDDGSTVTRNVVIDQPEETDPFYGSQLVITGMVLDGGFNGNVAPVKANFIFDEAAETGYLIVKYGQTLPDIDLSAYGYGLGKAFLGYFVGSNSFDLSGSVTFEWNEDMTELTVTGLPDDLNVADGADFANMVQTSAGWLYVDHIEGVKTLTR